MGDGDSDGLAVRLAISALRLRMSACFHWGRFWNFGSFSVTFAHCSTSLKTGGCNVIPSFSTSLFG